MSASQSYDKDDLPPGRRLRARVAEKQNTTTEERTGTVEKASLQQEIENQLAEETVRLPLGGERIQFRTLTGEESDKAALITEEISRIDGDDFREQYEDEIWWMCETIADCAEPEWMTPEWVKEYFTLRKRKRYLALLQHERDLSEGEIKKLQRRGML